MDEFLEEVKRGIEASILQNSECKLRLMALRHFETDGKMLRSLFIRDLALSLNLDLSLVIPWAVTCELLHNASLIHDDLQDGDEVRRGMPTIWKEFGPEQAINVGDFLLIISSQPLIRSSLICKVELLNLFTVMTSRIVSGQVDEFELNKLKSEENLFQQYLHCIAGKTSSLFSGLAFGVGIIAGLSEDRLHSLENIFFKLGNIFQIQDDILDFYGNKLRGERGCDIKEGKVSFLIAHYLERNPDHFGVLYSILRKKRNETSEEDFKLVEMLFREKNNLGSCLDHLDRLVDELRVHPSYKSDDVLSKLMDSLIQKILLPINEISQVHL